MTRVQETYLNKKVSQNETKHLLTDNLHRSFRIFRIAISAVGLDCRCFMGCVQDGLVVGREVWQLVMPDNAELCGGTSATNAVLNGKT